MASESSSAILELNDTEEDTEALSVTDEANEGTPLIMEHGYDIAIMVDAPLKQLSTLETFVTYRVRCVCARWPSPPQVRRRYNHFKVLHKRLSASHPLLAPPPLPPLHSARQQLDRYAASFVAVRTLALHVFLDRVAKHPILTHSEDFRIFLTTPDDEIDKVFKNKSENTAMNLWGLSSALYSNDNKSTNGARVKDPEFTSASDYLQSLSRKLTTLCSLTTKLYKESAALGAELMGMKRACDAWATQAGGRAALAAGAAGAGAAAAAGAGAGGGGGGRLRHAATLPLLAAYANAHHEKIRLRDTTHAALVAGNGSDELHNRLEQASEALRSELSDWMPKTRAQIKALLLDMADKQVNMYTQAVHGWEQALKLSTEANMDELFKTVSKTAIQNLSPSKCVTPTETDKDFDDLDNYSNDSDAQDFKNDDLIGKNVKDLEDSQECKVKSEFDGTRLESSDQLDFGSKSEFKSKTDSKFEFVDPLSDLLESRSGSKSNNGSECDNGDTANGSILDDPLRGRSNAEFKNEPETKGDCKTDVISDPLQDFSEIDLSS